MTKIFWDRKRGDVRAVDEISFSCQRGQIFGLLGPNGAGKTTALRIFSTLLKPTSGSAIVAGYDVSKNPKKVRKNVGFISGSTGIYQKLTPVEMVRYFGRLYGMSNQRIHQRTEEIFDVLDMHDFAYTLNSKLSSGMRQKVSIARAIIHDPPVLVFDEPTVSLDVLVARSVLEFIAYCRSQNKCVLLSTHIMAEAEKMCDQVAIVFRGKILAKGSIDQLREQTGKGDLETIFFSLITPEKGTKGDHC